MTSLVDKSQPNTSSYYPSNNPYQMIQINDYVFWREFETLATSRIISLI